MAMSAEQGQNQQQRERAPYLDMVGPQGDEATVPRPEEDPAAAATTLVESARQAEAFSQALMYARVS